MKKLYRYIPFLVILLSVCIFFYPFLFQGKLPIPSDTIVGLYHPYRDLYSDTNPNGLPYKNFLLTDPVRQQFPWKNLATSLSKNAQLPLWNPYEMAGTPLLANFQSSPFYPLNILLFFGAFSVSWSWFIFLEPLLAGIFLYLYLRNLKIDSRAALLGSLIWAFCGFSIAWLEWGVIVHTALWFPLILLAKDKLLENWSFRWGLVLVLGETAALLAGHLQIFFYVFVLGNVYLFAKIMQRSLSRKTEYKFLTFVKIYMPFIIAGILIFVLTIPQWLPTLQFISLSNRSIDQSWTQPGWFIPYQNLVQFIAPDFFGNYATLNYFGVWNYGEFIGYVGIGAVILSLYASMFRHDKKTWFFSGVVLLALIFATSNPLSQLPYMLKIPFIATAQPTRLMFVVDVSLAILAALGFDHFLRVKRRIWAPVIILGIVVVSLWILVFAGGNYFPTPDDLLVTKSNLKLPTLLFGLFSILFLLFEFGKNRRLQNAISLLIILFVLFDLFRFGWKFTPFTNPSYLYPKTKITTFLQERPGIFRIAATNSEILPPNFSIMYGLQSVEGYDPLYLTSYAQLIAANERSDHSITPPFGFNRIITPRNINTPVFDLLNVKYILSFDELPSPKYKQVMKEGKTIVYENTEVLPRVYFVENTVSFPSQADIAKQLFKKDLSTTALVLSPKQASYNFSVGHASITSYKPDKVVIKTENNDIGFLVFSDTNYPTLHATIDNRPAEIVPTNLAFRGLVIPRGKHTVVFEMKLF